MKLKKIVENMNRMPSTLKGFNESPKLSSEQKRKLMEMVSQYNTLGQKLRMESALIETATTLAEISELAETYACNEASDWFATEVVKTDFKRAKGITETFQKLARECHGKIQQLNALYEDMGHILGRYYEIADPMQEVCPNPSNVKSQRGLPNAQPQSVVQEVKPNDSNIKSQRQLPSNGSIKEIAVDDKNKNIKSQRNLPAGGPSTPQVKLREIGGSDKMEYNVQLVSGEEIDVIVEYEFFPGESPVGPDDPSGKMPTSGADSKVTIHSVINKVTGQELSPEECVPGTQERLIDVVYEYENSKFERDDEPSQFGDER
jgi:hypothetical protein